MHFVKRGRGSAYLRPFRKPKDSTREFLVTEMKPYCWSAAGTASAKTFNG
jgi:hypothetical protein